MKNENGVFKKVRFCRKWSEFKKQTCKIVFLRVSKKFNSQTFFTLLSTNFSMHKKNENGVFGRFLEKKSSFSKISCIEKIVDSKVKKV
jgi:hypothetical protein